LTQRNESNDWMSVLDTLIVGKRYLETVKLGDVVFEMGNLDAEEELEAMRYVDASASSIHSFNSTKRYLVVQAVESINGIPVSRASDARSALLSKINQMPLESILRLYDGYLKANNAARDAVYKFAAEEKAVEDFSTGGAASEEPSSTISASPLQIPGL